MKEEGWGGVNSPPCQIISGKVGNLRKHMREICYLLLTVPLQPVLGGGGQAGELLVVDAHPGHTAGQSHDLCKDLQQVQQVNFMAFDVQIFH